MQTLTRTQNYYRLEDHLREITTKFAQSQFEKGKLHGCDPGRYDNENEGRFTPCPYYHVGYVYGMHENLLNEKRIPKEQWKDYVLMAELKDPRFPLSSPAKYTLVLANSLPF